VAGGLDGAPAEVGDDGAAYVLGDVTEAGECVGVVEVAADRVGARPQGDDGPLGADDLDDFGVQVRRRTASGSRQLRGWNVAGLLTVVADLFKRRPGPRP
jgi:hypothetical protein